MILLYVCGGMGAAMPLVTVLVFNRVLRKDIREQLPMDDTLMLLVLIAILGSILILGAAVTGVHPLGGSV